MSLSRKKKEVITLISKMDETHLDALLLLLREPLRNEYELSDEEWRETDRRKNEVKKGNVKMLPARQAVKNITVALKKKSA